MKIEDRIREAAANKIRVVITSEEHSDSGFTVHGPNNMSFHQTKKEALNALLNQAIYSPDRLWIIQPAAPIKTP